MAVIYPDSTTAGRAPIHLRKTRRNAPMAKPQPAIGLPAVNSRSTKGRQREL